MRIFLAGAAGALGRQLVPLLTEAGHQVVGTTRDEAKAAAVRALGAEPVVLDALRADDVHEAVAKAQPDVVVHQLTALHGVASTRDFDKQFAQTNRLRSEGTDILLAAARDAGAGLFVAQSFAGWPMARTGGPVKTEDDPLDPDTAAPRTLAAMTHLEAAVTGSTAPAGVVLRYGLFYGPGTTIGVDGDITDMVRKRRFPLVGDAGGVWSMCHIADAARATVAAIDAAKPGTYAICDDEPAPVSQWLPALAAAVGARPPLRVPVWLARPLIGAQGINMMTNIRGCSNAKAKRELGWTPQYASWRQGFVRGL
jgi:2-alkyl-3-oxoalkanoate reductase